MNSSSSVIVGGLNNVIDSTARASILGGVLNRIESGATHASILGGRGLVLRGRNSVGYHANRSSQLTDAEIDDNNVAFFGNVDMWLANNRNQASKLKFFETYNALGAFPNGTNYTSFEAPASQTADIEYVLPDTSGIIGDLLSVRSVVGNRVTLDWSASGGGSAINVSDSAWSLQGNSGTDPTSDFIGTTDNQAVVFRVNNDTAMRFIPNATSPVIIGGYGGNTVSVASSPGAVIGGGGMATAPNVISGVSNGATILGGDGQLVESSIYGSIGGGVDDTIRANSSYAVIGGGRQNKVDSSLYAVNGGGFGNSIERSFGAMIGGGSANTIRAISGQAVIGGGASNRIDSAYRSAILGGADHEIRNFARYSTVTGGQTNIIDKAEYSVISGGRDNSLTGTILYSMIGSGRYNHIDESSGAFIGGGFWDTIQGGSSYGVIGGGSNNLIDTTFAGVIGGGSGNDLVDDADYSGIGGGRNNEIASTYYATVSGGLSNSIRDGADYSAIGGGRNNAIEEGASYGFIGGGWDNLIDSAALYSTLGGGLNNSIDSAAHSSTVGGGGGNHIRDNAVGATIAGGSSNVIGESGSASAIPGGRGLTLNGSRSFGFNANTQTGTRDMTIDDSDVAVFGNTDLWLANNNNSTSQLRFYESKNAAGAFPGATTFYSSFEAGNQTDTIEYILPTTAGAAGDVLEISAVNGDEITLEWDTDDNSSDLRFKTNIRTLANPLDSLLMLRGVRHDWRHAEFPNRHFPEHESIGFIAQEVEKIFPELVDTESDGYKKVQYAKVTALGLLRRCESSSKRLRHSEMDLRLFVERIAILQNKIFSCREQYKNYQTEQSRVDALRIRLERLEGLLHAEEAKQAEAKEIK